MKPRFFVTNREHIDGFNDNLFNYHYNRKYQTVFKDHSSTAENLKKTRQPRSKQDIKTLVWSVVVIFYFFYGITTLYLFSRTGI